MRKFLLFVFGIIAFSATVSSAMAQKVSSEDMLTAIEESGYQLDDQGNVTYMKIINAPGLTAKDIYLKNKEYFTFNYGSGKDVIQTDDSDQCVIIGKGFFRVDISLSYVNVWHLIRIDAKDGRSRVIIYLTEYEQPDGSKMSISSSYPINKNGRGLKKVLLNCYFTTLGRVNATFDAIEKNLQSSSIESQDW